MIVLAHTSLIPVQDTELVAARYLAEDTKVHHEIDLQILDRLVGNGSLSSSRVDPDFRQWVDQMFTRHPHGLIQLTCTSLSKQASLIDDHRLIAVDDKLLDEVKRRRWLKPLVVTTVESTKPVTQERFGGSSVEPFFVHVSEAFEALRSGNVHKHNHILVEAVRPYLNNIDVVVLPQASMLPAVSFLRAELPGVEVAHSFELAAKDLARKTNGSKSAKRLTKRENMI